MSEQLLRRVTVLERAVHEIPSLVVVLEKPTDEQRRLIEAVKRAGRPLRVIRITFG